MARPESQARELRSDDPTRRFRLDGATALVTGASSGLGAGFAVVLAKAGARVAVGARRLDKLGGTAEAVEAAGGEVFAMALDVTNESSCSNFVARAHQHFGSVDVLVNNAGMTRTMPALHEQPTEFEAVVQTNLLGSYYMARASARVMRSGSSIVNISSVHGIAASIHPQAAYAASKAAVIGLTRDLAQQWSARKGIRVNAIAPGYFSSEMTDGYDALDDLIQQRSLLGRWGTQEELDSALLFLASPASSFVTGTTLVVDGGMTATV